MVAAPQQVEWKEVNIYYIEQRFVYDFLRWGVYNGGFSHPQDDHEVIRRS
jgi:hypothetical protein